MTLLVALPSAPDINSPVGDYMPDEIEDWKLSAACVGKTRLFYSELRSDIEAAKEICRSCPVYRDCLEHSLSNHEKDGVWAGLTEAERRSKIRQRQRRARLGLG